MKIIRFQDDSGAIQNGCQHDGDQITLLDGDLYGDYQDTGQPAQVAKLLAPVAPVDIICIGLNYAHHADEANLPRPDHPVMFTKSSAVVILRLIRDPC